MAADRYREICAGFRWQVPSDFNIAHAVCGRYARNAGRDKIGNVVEIGGITGQLELSHS